MGDRVAGPRTTTTINCWGDAYNLADFMVPLEKGSSLYDTWLRLSKRDWVDW